MSIAEHLENHASDHDCRRTAHLTKPLAALSAFRKLRGLCDVLSSLFCYLQHQVENVSILRQVSRGRILQTSVHPSVNWRTLTEIRIDSGAELAIVPVGLFLALGLAMIAIHINASFIRKIVWAKYTRPS